MGEVESINKLQIDAKGNCTETKLIDAVNRMAVFVDSLSSNNEERRRICSYAINRFTDLKNSYVSFEKGIANECRNY